MVSELGHRQPGGQPCQLGRGAPADRRQPVLDDPSRVEGQITFKGKPRNCDMASVPASTFITRNARVPDFPCGIKEGNEEAHVFLQGFKRRWGVKGRMKEHQEEGSGNERWYDGGVGMNVKRYAPSTESSVGQARDIEAEASSHDQTRGFQHLRHTYSTETGMDQ